MGLIGNVIIFETTLLISEGPPPIVCKTETPSDIGNIQVQYAVSPNAFIYASTAV